MAELPVPRETYIHLRGNFERRGKRVLPATPAFLPPMEEGKDVNRLSFARWLVNRRHPLTARVMVNRIWAQYFGRGLVATLDDFGTQGELPSHPALLDWLAVEFIESGWDVKAIHRLILMSSTYRQSSRRSDALEEKDPANRWLARGPRIRLSAEQIRDAALSVSGLLVEGLGGPSVFPRQPDGVGEFRDATAGSWETSEGKELYRRSLYTFWQRMSPYPAMTLFDAPSRERSCVRRDVTNTPLQALALLNDPAYVEAAIALAESILVKPLGFVGRLTVVFQRVLTRLPLEEEVQRFVAFDHQLREQGVEKETERWRSICLVILNLDEAITRE